MKFKEWVSQFVEEESKRGDLARHLMEDNLFTNSLTTWGEAFYRLHIRGASQKVTSVFSEVWRKYKAEHGEDIIYFELMDVDTNTYFSEFVTEKEAYQFFFKLESLGIEFDIISEPEGNINDNDCDLFLIELGRSLKSSHYSCLDEIVNELNKFNNVVPFPLGKVTK